ncbi:MAG TPA: LysR family transcriptional regulator [Anaeromyxobacteraceae bacterium]|nr:LysR family transcriptional regulator [Anaeromyxobacteraceae bacterium]
MRFFLELSRTGSHARAAARLGVDRNTVARRVAALEVELGVTLFERGPQGWCRTTAGEELAGLASRIEEDVLALARHADASDRSASGSVRLTTIPYLSVSLLAPALPLLRARHPALLLEVSAEARNFNLTRREADLALRMGRPRAAGLVMRKMSDVAHALYASRGLTGGKPRAVRLDADPFMGFEDSLASTPQERWMEHFAPGRRLVFRSNSTASLLAAARAGVGVALLPCFLADPEPDLVRLDGAEPVNHEMWLLVHGDLRRTPRVRAVIEWLDEVVERARPALTGRG